MSCVPKTMHCILDDHSYYNYTVFSEVYAGAINIDQYIQSHIS